jgi:predicted ATPase/DNA-binding winged helix-turn-helix (wHTH) protein
MDEHAISFGPYRLLASQRLLLEGDKPVRLGSRAFDILAALVERAGEVVDKEQLIARAWPQTFVEEANLKIQVSALRRALGDGQGGNRYVITVPGRGYNFVAPVRRGEPSRASPPPTVASTAAHNLPFAATRMIGREEAVAALVSRLSHQRLVTIVGPGGIGKTTIALALAEHMIDNYEHGVWLIDLAPLSDASLVPSAVATVLGLEIRTENPVHDLIAAVRDKRKLLLLDNCEHLINAVASLATALLGGARGVSILATSREPLGVAGEREYHLGPLGSPQASDGLTAAEAAAFPAVQLFVERVTAIIDDFALVDATAPVVAEICRRLDGLPLAIEFAAPRVEVLGVEGLAARLGDSLHLLGARRRTTMPRHRTMRAVVDWSYGLLSGDEQLFFRALGIFVGGFTVEAADAVALDPPTTRIGAMDRLADLVAKSLVVADVSGAKSRFRLLDTTRAFAIEKFDENGERERLARRHAGYYRYLFERAEGEERVRSAGEWLADYACEIDNLRAARDWAFSPGGNGSIGVALTAAAVPLWMRLSLFTECHSCAKQALDSLGIGGRPCAEMKLHTALGTSLIYASRVIGPEIGPALTSALEIAESLDDTEYQLRSIWGLWGLHSETGRYRAALPFAQKFHELAIRVSDSNGRLFGERMMGSSKHFLGDQIGARRHLERVLSHYPGTDHGWEVIRFGTDLRVSVHALLARVLWLQGFVDQAVRTAEASIGEAQATGHAASLCYALATAACPISLWVGNLAAATHYTGMLLDDSRKHGMPLWSAFGSRFQRLVVLKSGDLATGSRRLQTSLDEIADPDVSFRLSSGLSELAVALTHAGRVAEALALVEAGIEKLEAGWATPELLRLKGDLLLLQRSGAGAEMAQELFRQALQEARQHGALSWELRAATSLARLLCRQGQSAAAIACLEPVFDRFTEGFETTDLISARQLLDELSGASRR